MWIRSIAYGIALLALFLIISGNHPVIAQRDYPEERANPVVKPHKRTPSRARTPALPGTSSRRERPASTRSAKPEQSVFNQVEEALQEGNSARNARRYDEALAHYKRAVSLNGNEARAYYGIGNIYSDQGHYAEAVTAYQKAITLNSNYADAYNNLGIAYYALKRYDEALAAYKKAIELNPKGVVPYQTWWRSEVGNILQPVPAHLRSATYFDIVGVNTKGTVYALNGATGVVLWSEAVRQTTNRDDAQGSNSASAFTPIVYERRDGLASVIVPFEGGVRSLDGATGRELWRAKLQGLPASGVSADIDGDGQAEIIIAEEKPPALSILSEAGKNISSVSLDAPAVGAPLPFITEDARGVLLALESGLIELRTIAGERPRAVKLDSKPTTPPLIVPRARIPLFVVGVEGNLISFDLNDPNFKPIGRILTLDDAPRGVLSSVDLEGDGKQEVVMVTRHGRVVVISADDGKIKWFTGGVTDTSSVAFADLNGDGIQDLLVPATPFFAIGFSGQDHSLIWRSEEIKTYPPSSSSKGLRGLALILAENVPNLLAISSDGTGLRAIGLPTNTIKASTQK